MTTLLLFAMIGLGAAQETPAGKPKVPKDSIELLDHRLPDRQGPRRV